MKNIEHRPSYGFLAAVLSLGLVGATQPAAAERHGFYAGAEVGIAQAQNLDSHSAGVSHPTKCDTLLADHAPANDPECDDDTPGTFAENRFDLGTGYVGALSLGYMTGRWRVELEYLHRRHDGDFSPWRGAGGNTAEQTKADEWSTDFPPSEEVRDFSSHQFFVNAYYDFLGHELWTPYVGAGVGLAPTRLRYHTRFIRKPLPQYRDDNPVVEDFPDSAAGTLSFLDTGLSETLFGFQLLAGVDYALTEKTSVSLKARWAQFEELEEGATWDLIRSHAPVQADGETPFTSRQKFDDVEYWALTVGLKYRF